LAKLKLAYSLKLNMETVTDWAYAVNQRCLIIGQTLHRKKTV